MIMTQWYIEITVYMAVVYARTDEHLCIQVPIMRLLRVLVRCSLVSNSAVLIYCRHIICTYA